MPCRRMACASSSMRTLLPTPAAMPRYTFSFPFGDSRRVSARKSSGRFIRADHYHIERRIEQQQALGDRPAEQSCRAPLQKQGLDAEERRHLDERFRDVVSLLPYRNGVVLG